MFKHPLTLFDVIKGVLGGDRRLSLWRVDTQSYAGENSHGVSVHEKNKSNQIKKIKKIIKKTTYRLTHPSTLWLCTV